MAAADGIWDVVWWAYWCLHYPRTRVHHPVHRRHPPPPPLLHPYHPPLHHPLPVLPTFAGLHSGSLAAAQVMLANVSLQLVVLELMALALDPRWELPQVEQMGCLQSLVS